MSRQSVAVVAFDRISPFHLSVPCLVFGQECYDPCAQAFDLRVCAAEPGRLRTTVGFTIEAEAGLEALAEAQTVIVPSWRDPHERPPQALLDALIAARARGAQLVGLCLGPSCWPRPGCSTVAAPPPTGCGRRISLGASLRCGWSPTCCTSRTTAC